jgi:hypothetical protein
MIPSQDVESPINSSSVRSLRLLCIVTGHAAAPPSSVMNSINLAQPYKLLSAGTAEQIVERSIRAG